MHPGQFLRRWLGRATGQVRADLRDDPYLGYILVGALVMAGFWFWHRIPNFATRDEHSRLMDVMVAYGSVIADPSYESLRAGIVWSRVPFGATVYLFGLAVLPVVIVALLTGQIGVFEVFARPSWEFGFYESWQATPRWIWTWSLGFVRLFTVAFAVGSVYLTYRIGTTIRDRGTGRLSAVLLTLTFGFLTIAHEGGEDMPALFFILLTIALLVQYIETGAKPLFLAGSLFGGVAIAFKLTAAPVVVLVGLAHLLRARATGEQWRETLFAPNLLVAGALFGLGMIILGFPTALVAGFEPFIDRVFGDPMGRMSHATGPDAPVWWWFLRGYFSALGLPLFVAAVGGVLASAVHLRRRDADFAGTVLVLTGLLLYLAILSQWHDFRVHHLLPTFPLLALLLGSTLDRVRDRRPTLAQPVIALLVVTTAMYAGVGTAGFASMPRDQAEAWLVEHAPENATMEIYRRNMQDAAVPHGMTISHAFGPEGGGERLDPCPTYIQLGYRDLLHMKAGTYYRNSEPFARYVRALLDGEYNYTIAAEFGTRPPDFLPQRPTPGSLTELLGHGIRPQTDQFADEQELAANQYTVILKRTGPCDRRPVPPI